MLFWWLWFMYLICMKDTKCKSNIENKIKSEEYIRRCFFLYVCHKQECYIILQTCAAPSLVITEACVRGATSPTTATVHQDSVVSRAICVNNLMSSFSSISFVSSVYLHVNVSLWFFDVVLKLITKTTLVLVYFICFGEYNISWFLELWYCTS